MLIVGLKLRAGDSAPIEREPGASCSIQGPRLGGNSDRTSGLCDSYHLVSSGVARKRVGRTRGGQVPALVLAISLATPVARDATASPAPDLSAFDQGFRAGQNEYDRRDYLTAARTWTRTADLLPEAAEHKDNRAAMYEYIADSYEKAVVDRSYEATMRECLAVLDAYAEGYAAAYPGEAVPERVEVVRASFREKLAVGEAARRRFGTVDGDPRAPSKPPVVTTAPTQSPPARPWRGLTIGGAVGVGSAAAMLTMFAVGAARARSATREFNDPANECGVPMLSGECSAIDARGRRANALAVAGLAAAPLLLGAGVAMLVVGARRKAKATSLVPTLGRGMVGLVWQRRF
jgi:hypothetical protein